MKKCSRCGSISSHNEHACGVCGSSLIDTPSISLEQAKQIHGQPFHLERRAGKTGIVGVLAGVGLLALSGLCFYLNSLVLILMILPGLFIIMIGITSQGNVRLRGWRGRNAKTAPILPTGDRTHGETDKESGG